MPPFTKQEYYEIARKATDASLGIYTAEDGGKWQCVRMTEVAGERECAKAVMEEKDAEIADLRDWKASSEKILKEHFDVLHPLADRMGVIVGQSVIEGVKILESRLAAAGESERVMMDGLRAAHGMLSAICDGDATSDRIKARDRAWATLSLPPSISCQIASARAEVVEATKAVEKDHPWCFEGHSGAFNWNNLKAALTKLAELEKTK